MSAVDHRIKRIVASCIARCPVAPDAMADELELVADLGADELELVQLAIELEAAFVIELSDEAMEEIKTVGDLIAAVDARAIGRAVRQ